jgi:hypothetical protein
LAPVQAGQFLLQLGASIMKNGVYLLTQPQK